MNVHDVRQSIKLPVQRLRRALETQPWQNLRDKIQALPQVDPTVSPKLANVARATHRVTTQAAAHLGNLLSPPRVSAALGLGSTSLWLVRRGRGTVVREPSCLALEGGKVRSIGAEAWRLEGRSPASVELVWPLAGGRIMERARATVLIRHALRQARLVGQPLVLAIPHELTPAERRTMEQVAHAAGAGPLYLLDAALAGAVGAGMDVMAPGAVLTVDIGATTTRVSVICLGEVVFHRSFAMGGTDLDRTLVEWFAHEHRLHIGLPTAERVKLAAGCAEPRVEAARVEVDGMSLEDGLPRRIEVSSKQVSEALQPVLVRLADCVQSAFEELPPTVLGDIVDVGSAILLGGTSRLPGMARFLSRQTHLSLVHPPQAERAAAAGIEMLLLKPELRRALLVPAVRTANVPRPASQGLTHGLAWALGAASLLLVWQLTGPLLARSTGLDRGIMSAMVPLWKMASTYAGHSDTARAVDPMQRKLRVQLAAAHHQIRALSNQNAHLRRLIKLQSRMPMVKTTAGLVVARDPASWLQTLVLDLGRQNHLANGMAVESDNGVVGRVADVSNASSRVRTLTFHGATTAAVVPRRKAAGVVY
ncbi:MAG TPA: rod shape-determining protein, partial [Candidatus Xenobia bacterium]